MLRAPPLAAPLLAAPLAAETPHLEKRGHARQLVVDGKPFLILGGGLGNSSVSSREYAGDKGPKLQADFARRQKFRLYRYWRPA